MCKKRRYIYLFAFLVIFHFEKSAANVITDKGSELPFSSGETLHYLLSYRGLLTSMIWADIADVKMVFLANKQTPEQRNGHQFVLHLSTENYTKAEMIHPVRYTYTATMDKTMHRTLLVEEEDTGASESHEFLWLDWRNKESQLFKKREKEQVSSDFFSLDDEDVWEKDGKQGIPDFLSEFPLIDGTQTYLIHKGSGSKITDSQILEPLSMIYSLRSLNIDAVKKIPLVISDHIRIYRIERIGMEEINANGMKYQAIKYKIQRNGKKDKRFYIWLSNDKIKIPLRFTMEAPLGKLELQLVKVQT